MWNYMTEARTQRWVCELNCQRRPNVQLISCFGMAAHRTQLWIMARIMSKPWIYGLYWIEFGPHFDSLDWIGLGWIGQEKWTNVKLHCIVWCPVLPLVLCCHSWSYVLTRSILCVCLKNDMFTALTWRSADKPTGGLSTRRLDDSRTIVSSPKCLTKNCETTIAVWVTFKNSQSAKWMTDSQLVCRQLVRIPSRRVRCVAATSVVSRIDRWPNTRHTPTDWRTEAGLHMATVKKVPQPAVVSFQKDGLSVDSCWTH